MNNTQGRRDCGEEAVREKPSDSMGGVHCAVIRCILNTDDHVLWVRKLQLQRRFFPWPVALVLDPANTTL